MATYLELCQDAATEAGYIDRSQMTDVAAGGAAGQVAGWVRRAWRQIQTGSDSWFFLRRSFSKEIDPSMGSRLAPEDLVEGGVRSWLVVGVRSDAERAWSLADLTEGGGADGALINLDWTVFRRQFVFTPAEPARPLYFAIDPSDRSVHIGPPMRAGSRYRLTGDYIAPTQTLRANGDVPQGIPEDYTEAIMWLAVTFALEHLGGDDRQKMDAKMEYDRAIGALLLVETPPVTFARPPI